MSGYEDLKNAIQGISKANSKRLKNTYLAKVVSLNPLKISNSYFGVIDKQQLYIIDKTKVFLDGITTSINDKHSHDMRPIKLSIGDEVLILLCEQEELQKFILIDKVVAL